MKREEAVAGRFIQDGCGTRVYICGHNVEGIPVGQLCDRQPSTLSYVEWDRWELLPAECKSFDWQPETFPQWFIPTEKLVSAGHNKEIAFYRRDSDDTGRTFHTDGSSFEFLTWEYEGERTCTEAEALALLEKPVPVIPDGVYYCNQDMRGNFYDMKTKKGMGTEFWDKWKHLKHLKHQFPRNPEPVESPDDWVTQDRVPIRICDERRWVDPATGEPESKADDWESVRSAGTMNFYRGRVHGYISEDGLRLELRCRWKDLPPLPEPVKPATRKVVINRYAVTDDGNHWWIVFSDKSPEYLQYKDFGVYEEIEVPL